MKSAAEKGIRTRHGSYVAYLTINGKEVKRTIGAIGVVTLAAAIAQRVEWQKQIQAGTYNAKPVAPPEVKPPISFAAIADSALNFYKTRKRCWDAAECRIKVFKEWFANRTAESITSPEITSHLDAKVVPPGTQVVPRGKWSECTANEYRVSLIRVFNLAIDDGLLAHNPAAKVKAYEFENERTRELSEKEETALRAVIQRDYPHKLCEFDLLLHTGMRKSNLYGQAHHRRRPMAPLDWKDVNLDFKTATLPRSKAGKGYVIPLNSVAVAALRVLQARGDTGPVVKKPSGIVLKSCRRWFENCLEEAKIENFRLHDLRHTFGSRLRASGVAMEDIKHLLGHSAKSITERYAHISMPTLHSAVATLVKPATGTKPEQSKVTEIRKTDAA